MKMVDYIAMPEGAGICGATVMWSLGGLVPATLLNDKLTAEGLPPRHVHDQEKALRRALAEFEEKGVFVDPTATKGTWNLVHTKPGQERNEYDVGLSVKLGDKKQIVLDPSDHPLAEALEDAFERHQDSFMGRDLGAYLTVLSLSLGGVVLRDCGGVYFIPRAGIERFTKAAECIESVGDSNYCVAMLPTMKSDEALKSITFALQAEAAKATAELHDEITKGSVQQERAFKSRHNALQGHVQKLKDYEALLGMSLRAVMDNLSDAHDALNRAAIAQGVGGLDDLSL